MVDIPCVGHDISSFVWEWFLVGLAANVARQSEEGESEFKIYTKSDYWILCNSLKSGNFCDLAAC